MGFLEDLEDFFPDTISIRTCTSIDGKGNRSYGSSYDIKAYVYGKTQLVLNLNGEERTSSVQAILFGAPGAKPEDEFTLPVRFNPRVQPAVHVDHHTDEAGALYEKVYF